MTKRFKSKRRKQQRSKQCQVHINHNLKNLLKLKHFLKHNLQSLSLIQNRSLKRKKKVLMKKKLLISKMLMMRTMSQRWLVPKSQQVSFHRQNQVQQRVKKKRQLNHKKRNSIQVFLRLKLWQIGMIECWTRKSKNNEIRVPPCIQLRRA